MAYGEEMDGASAPSGAVTSDLDDDMGGDYEADETAALAEAFPELNGSPERIASLQAAIKMCVDNALAKRDSVASADKPASSPTARGKGGSVKSPLLMLAFGGKGKK